MTCVRRDCASGLWSSAMLGAALLAAAWLLAAGCGGRTIWETPDGGSNNNYNGNGNGNSNWNHNGNGGECAVAGDCTMAVKTDECCSCPVAASQADMAADPCLVPVGEPTPDGCAVPCPAIPCQECLSSHYTADCQGGQCVTREGECAQDTDCVIGIRVDNCCEQAFPVTLEDIQEDICLVRWSDWGYWDQVPQECYDRWDPICDMIDCAPAGPWSRATECSPEGCRLVPECSQESQCTLMTDHSYCCSCPTSWPTSMLGHDPCVVPAGEQPGPGCHLPDCEQVLCEPCYVPFGSACEGSRCVDLWLDGFGQQ